MGGKPEATNLVALEMLLLNGAARGSLWCGMYCYGCLDLCCDPDKLCSGGDAVQCNLKDHVISSMLYISRLCVDLETLTEV